MNIRPLSWAFCLTLLLCACGGGGGGGGTTAATGGGQTTPQTPADLVAAVTEQPSPPEPEPELEFRSIDGSGNNLTSELWGSANTPLRRELPSAYADGVSQPSGVTRPRSPRDQ